MVGLETPAVAQNTPTAWLESPVTGVLSNARAQDWGFHTMVQDLDDAGGVNGRSRKS